MTVTALHDNSDARGFAKVSRHHGAIERERQHLWPNATGRNFSNPNFGSPVRTAVSGRVGTGVEYRDVDQAHRQRQSGGHSDIPEKRPVRLGRQLDGVAFRDAVRVPSTPTVCSLSTAPSSRVWMTTPHTSGTISCTHSLHIETSKLIGSLFSVGWATGRVYTRWYRFLSNCSPWSSTNELTRWKIPPANCWYRSAFLFLGLTARADERPD